MKLFWVAVLIAMLGSLTACDDGDADVTLPEPAESTTTAPALPTLVFDGDTCIYRGPSAITGGGLSPVALENTSEIDINAGLFRVRNQDALDAALDRLPPGTGSDILLGAPPGSEQVAWLRAPAGDRNEESLLLGAGLYLFDCGRIPYDASNVDFVWRGGSFEVVVEE